jgi:hypothetical protein
MPPTDELRLREVEALERIAQNTGDIVRFSSLFGFIFMQIKKWRGK